MFYTFKTEINNIRYIIVKGIDGKCRYLCKWKLSAAASNIFVFTLLNYAFLLKRILMQISQKTNEYME